MKATTALNSTAYFLKNTIALHNFEKYKSTNRKITRRRRSGS